MLGCTSLFQTRSFFPGRSIVRWPVGRGFAHSIVGALTGVLLAGTSAFAIVEPIETAPSPVSGLEGRGGPVGAGSARAHSDTLHFGYVDSEGYAILGESWTWDHGDEDPLEGWYGSGVAEQGLHFRRIDAADWISGGNTVPAPILAGEGSAWVGLYRVDADAECWRGGTGYGNGWEQLLVSPMFTYAGAGDVDLELTYFTDVEADFDYARVLLRRGAPDQTLEEITGRHGINGSDPPVGELLSLSFGEAEMAGETEFQIVFALSSDGGWSDEDGSYETDYGPMAVDDVSVSGAVVDGPFAYDFEADLQGWTPETGVPGANLLDVADVDTLGFDIPPDCPIADNVLYFADESGTHPPMQRTLARSNPVDITNDVLPLLPGSGPLRIVAQWDWFADVPPFVEMFYRPGWDYYPYVCEETGAVSWSGRVGQGNFFYLADGCRTVRNEATAHGVPASAEKVRFIYEIYYPCVITQTPCEGEPNETPFLDNAEIFFFRDLAPSSTGDPEEGSGVTRLIDAYPNPALSTTTVQFELAGAGHVAVDVFDASGRRVRSLIDGDREAGIHEVVWDGTDDRAAPLPAGVYWTHLRTDHFRSSKRLVILP